MKEYTAGYDDLYKVVKEMFMGIGYSEYQAAATTNSLVESDARHIHSHGVVMLASYLEYMETTGCLKLDAPAPTVIHETPVSFVMDGHSGVGYAISELATKKCIEKAKKSGICISAVRYANHYGFAGYWSEMMAKEGFIGISSTNTIRGVCPTRSADRILGTNPIAVAVPTAGGEPMFLLDMATSAMPYGKISRSKVFAESGVLPENILINAKGESIISFSGALELLAHGDTESKTPDRPAGGLIPLGGATEMHCGYKGYGLALLVELLTGGLSGGIPSKFIPYAGEGICFFLMAISPELFGERQAVLKHMKYIIEEYRKAQPISNDMPVLIPGDKERMYRNEALKSGITLSEDIVNRLRYVAQRTGKEDEFEKIFTVKE